MEVTAGKERKSATGGEAVIHRNKNINGNK